MQVKCILHRGCVALVAIPPRGLPDIVDYFDDGIWSTAFYFHGTAPIYIDGSGMFGKTMEIRTAASAAVQCDEGHEGVWTVVSWAVPDNVDQTSVVAETIALLITVRHLSSRNQVHCLRRLYGRYFGFPKKLQ